MKTKIYIYIVCFIFLFISCKKEILVFDSVADENLELPLLLNFNEKACFLDIETKTFKFPVHEDLIENFSPYTEFQEYSQVIFNSVELQNKSVNNLGDILINKPYSLTIISHGETADFTLYFSKLPLIQIITLDNIKDEPKIFARLIINYSEPDKASVNTLTGIELRGSSTEKLEKKSYGFELLNSFNTDDIKIMSLFDMHPNNKWALDGMAIDSARMRNKVSFDIWTALSEDNDHIGIQTEFTEVFHNFKSLGLYSFIEIFTEHLLSLNTESVLIVGKANTDETQFYDVAHEIFQNTFWNKWEQRYPDPDERLNWNAFEDLCKLVVESDDSEFKDRIFEIIDEKNVIDYYIFINVCYGFDNLGKNWFFMKKSRNEKFNIIPWDMDATWGRRYTSRRVEYDKIASNGLFDRLLEVNPQDFRQKLKHRWNELKDDELSEDEILVQFDDNFEILNHSGCVDDENRIWNANLDLIYEQNFIHVWVRKRLIFLDSYFEGL